MEQMRLKLIENGTNLIETRTRKLEHGTKMNIKFMKVKQN